MTGAGDAARWSVVPESSYRFFADDVTSSTQACGDIAFLTQNCDRLAAISPCWFEIATTGLRRYRHFGLEVQQACGDIAIWAQNGNRPVAISPCWCEIATGLRRYRLVGLKIQQGCGDIAFWVYNCNRPGLNIVCISETALYLV